MKSADIKMLPIRETYKLFHYEDFGQIRIKDNSIKKQDLTTIQYGDKILGEMRYQLDSDTVQAIKHDIEITGEKKPVYSYFLHDRMDGIIPAYQMKETLGNKSIMLKDAFTGETSTSCIKRKKQIHIGLQQEIIQKKPILNMEKKGKLISAILSFLLSLGSFIISVLTASVNNVQLIHIDTIPKIIPITICVISGLLTVYLIACRHKEQQNILFSELKVAIRNMSDTQFYKYISNFVADDYAFPELKNAVEGTDIICPLCMYSSREQAVLHQYWKTNQRKEHWWIFVEDNVMGNPLILDQSNKYSRGLYRLLPLSYIDKQKLAFKLDSKNMQDPGLKFFGVDYVAQQLLPSFIVPENETDGAFLLRLEQFVDRNKERFPFDIPRVIRLIAELAVTFRVDFSDSQDWEPLFSFASTDDLSVIDYKLSEKLVSCKSIDDDIASNQLRYLVSCILSEFDKNLYQVIKINYGPRMMAEDRQLCLAKAIRYYSGKSEDHCLAIAECLYAEIKKYVDNPDAFSSSEWNVILEQALIKLLKYKFGWFTADILHFLLQIWDKKPSEGLLSLLCTETVKKASKEMIMFYNQERLYEDARDIDVIGDHAHLMSIVNKDKSFTLDTVPWTGILYLTNEQKEKYAGSIQNGENDDLLQYYQILFEVFVWNATARGNVSALYRHMYPTVNPDCINRLLKFVEKTGEGRDWRVSEGCVLLKNIMIESKNNNINRECVEKCLYYMALWDALGFSIGNFAASIVFQEAGLYSLDKNNYETSMRHLVRLNLGNSVARLVYMTCVQRKESSSYSQNMIELTDALLAYEHPSKYILCYIIYTTRFLLPEKCKDRLLEYCNSMMEIVEIKPEKREVEPKDLVKYIVDVKSCGAFDLETKKAFLRILLDNFEENYKDREDKDIIFEFLCRYIDGTSTPKFSNSTAKDIMEETISCCSSDNMIYMIYSLLCDDNEYMRALPVKVSDIEMAKLSTRIVHPLLQTDFMGGTHLLIRQWIKLIRFDSKSNEYWAVAKELYKKIIRIIDGHDIDSAMGKYRLEQLRSFFDELEEKKNIWPKEYSNCFSEEKLKKIRRFFSRQEQLRMVIDIQDAMHTKQLGSYPLLECIRLILELSKIEHVDKKEYIRLTTDTEKEDWLRINMIDLCPIEKENDKIQINKTFIDGLKLAIDKNDEELAAKAQMVIETNETKIVNTVFDDVEQRKEIIELIDIYKHKYNMDVRRNKKITSVAVAQN
ncbi:hypothetical protein JS518_14005 [Clostridiales bacterium FE2010]|nr:hypothetical protein JS518_14005 [Clostridiales bacterium FE2010]